MGSATRPRVLGIVTGLLPWLALLSCQQYDFVFQPDADRQGSHLRFVVERPSKADILFVIDNSVSMTEEQVALGDSIGVLLGALAPQDTRGNPELPRVPEGSTPRRFPSGRATIARLRSASVTPSAWSDC